MGAVIVRSNKGGVYHDPGYYDNARTQQRVTACGSLWYREDSHYFPKPRPLSVAQVANQRPCLKCFPDRYTKREVERDSGPGYETTKRDLAWRTIGK